MCLTITLLHDISFRIHRTFSDPEVIHQSINRKFQIRIRCFFSHIFWHTRQILSKVLSTHYFITDPKNCFKYGSLINLLTGIPLRIQTTGSALVIQINLRYGIPLRIPVFYENLLTGYISYVVQFDDSKIF